MTNFVRSKHLLSLVVTACGIASDIQVSPFDAVVVYGDSLSDNGNLFSFVGVPGSPYYLGRRSDGHVAVEQLAASLNAPLVDFAWIGATTGIGNYGDGGNPATFGAFGLPGMLTEFSNTQAFLGPYVSNSLFVIWSGPNDFLAPVPGDSPLDIVTRAVTNELTLVLSLRALGVTNILVPGMPDLGLTPYFRSLGPVAAGQASLITDAYNGALQAALLPTGALYFDTAGLIRSIVANPGAYGFSNATEPCLDVVAGTLCADSSKYMFFDEFHPTLATDARAAQGFLVTAVPEPSTILMVSLGLGFCIYRRSRPTAA